MDRYAPPGALGPLGGIGGSAASPGEGGAGAGLFRVLWRQKVLVAIPVVVFLALAVAYLMTERKLFTSTARLEVKPAGSRLSGEAGDGSSGNASNFLFTQREKLLSREILALALTQPLPDKAGRLLRDLRTFKEAEVPALTTLRDGADVEVGKKDDVLSVHFESPYPDEAATVANAIVEAYMRYQTQPKHSNTADVLDAHRSEKKKVEQELARVTDKMGALEQQYGVLSGNGNDNIAFKQLTFIEQQLQAARSETLKCKADFDEAARTVHKDPRLLNGGQDSMAGLASAEDEQVLRAELLQLDGKLQDMRAHYLPEHPAVQAMQRKVDQFAAAYAQAVQRRYLRAKAAEDDLQAQFDKQNARAMEVSAKAAQYAHLREEESRFRKLFDTLDTRVHAIELQQAAGAVDIDFWDHADASLARRTHPSPVRAIGVAMMLGLVLGCSLALLRDWMDDRLRSADEIKGALGVPLLGVVPAMPAGVSPTVSAQKSVLDPTGEVAEAYRSVRTNVYFGAPRDRAKTILVTSPSAGDGKTTCASNLAAVIAQTGKKVLLIDADLRSPTLHTVFGLKDNRIGLSGLLNGQGTLERAVQGTSVDGLDILPCGPKPRNPGEMLNSPMFSELLEMLADKYDQIVIDSPPVMGLADARIIAASCDVTLLVLRADRSTRKLATLARDGLAGVGAIILGAIVNDVSRRSAYHDASYRYGGGSASDAKDQRDEDADEHPAAGALARNGSEA